MLEVHILPIKPNDFFASEAGVECDGDYAVIGCVVDELKEAADGGLVKGLGGVLGDSGDGHAATGIAGDVVALDGAVECDGEFAEGACLSGGGEVLESVLEFVDVRGCDREEAGGAEEVAEACSGEMIAP